MADLYGIQARLGDGNTPSIASATTALVENASRALFMIQNLGTNVLFVRLGAGASSTVFHFALKGGTGNDDGLGGSFVTESSIIWTGEVSIAGTSPRYTVMELTA